jgi:hypothetical protein
MKKSGGGGVVIQTRDVGVLRGLLESRVATLAHLADLHFDGRKEAAKKRIQKLNAAGLIRTRPRRSGEPIVLQLTRRAFELLRQSGYLADFPALSLSQFERRCDVSGLTLRHELDVMDVKAAMTRSLRGKPVFSAVDFSTWPRLSEFKAYHPATRAMKVVKSDAYLHIRESLTNRAVRSHRFFLELDRSTESRQVLVAQIQCYLDFYNRGGMAKRCGGNASEFRDFPFRVLIVCKSESRRDGLAEILGRMNPPIRSFVCLATIADLTNDPLAAIWVTPSDVLKGGNHRRRLFPVQ